MLVVDDAKPNCKDLPRRNNKRREMLFKLLDHPIDKHLTKCAQNTHYHHMDYKKTMLEYENEYIHDFQ